MKNLARLCWAAVAVAYGEVLLGSWTRINGAGMTCPDYPLCHGKILPQLGGGTLWEWAHRVTAAALAVLVIAVVAKAWQARRVRFIWPAAAVVAGLFALQVFLGAATVRLANAPLSVVWHWGAAMALVGSLAALAIFARAAQAHAPERQNGTAPAAVLAGTAGIAFLTMCIGAYVSSSGAGLACASLPGCAGNVVVYSDGQYVQMLHRLAAAVCLIAAVAAFAFVWVQHTSARVRLWTSLALGLVFAQIVLGLLNVALRLPLDLREAHAANAALTFLCFVCAATLAWLDAFAVREPARVS